MQKIYRHAFGWFLIFLGIIGLFLPVLQGGLFLFLGVIILGPEVPLFHRFIIKFEKRHPKLFVRARRLLRRLKHRFGIRHEKPRP